jgi:hypothetical protein
MIRHLLPAGILLAAAASSLTACTNEELYNGIQVNRRMNCLELHESTRQACLDRYNMDYPEYKEGRDQIKASDEEPRTDADT